MMRKLLDRMVGVAAVLAGLLLVAMVAVMFAAIVMRQFGLLLPGHEEIATFTMVGMAFLGLPYAYRTGAQVRVESLLSRLPGHAKRRMNVWCTAVGGAICVAFSYYSFGLTWDSYEFGDVSVGLLAIPQWIPQLPIPVGLALLALTLFDDLLVLVRGGRASFETATEGSATQAE